MVVCLHCHTVQPLTVGGMIAEVAPSFSTEYGRLCPQCMSDDLRIWDGHTCPKCNGKMQQEGKEEPPAHHRLGGFAADREAPAGACLPGMGPVPDPLSHHRL